MSDLERRLTRLKNRFASEISILEVTTREAHRAAQRVQSTRQEIEEVERACREAKRPSVESLLNEM